jgi:hypothetical protein
VDRLADTARPRAGHFSVTRLGTRLFERVGKLDVLYLNNIQGAQIGVCIDPALQRNLRGKTLKVHIKTGFDIYWRGIAL